MRTKLPGQSNGWWLSRFRRRTRDALAERMAASSLTVPHALTALMEKLSTQGLIEAAASVRDEACRLWQESRAFDVDRLGCPAYCLGTP